MTSRTLELDTALHAVEGNSSGSLQLLPFYTALVMDLADGKPVTFDSAKSKPYVRTARCPNGHSKKLKATQSTRMEKAIAAVLQENPALAGKYTKADCRVRSLTFTPGGSTAMASLDFHSLQHNGKKLLDRV